MPDEVKKIMNKKQRESSFLIIYNTFPLNRFNKKPKF